VPGPSALKVSAFIIDSASVVFLSAILAPAARVAPLTATSSRTNANLKAVRPTDNTYMRQTAALRPIDGFNDDRTARTDELQRFCRDNASVQTSNKMSVSVE